MYNEWRPIYTALAADIMDRGITLVGGGEQFASFLGVGPHRSWPVRKEPPGRRGRRGRHGVQRESLCS